MGYASYSQYIIFDTKWEALGFALSEIGYNTVESLQKAMDDLGVAKNNLEWKLPYHIVEPIGKVQLEKPYDRPIEVYELTTPKGEKLKIGLGRPKDENGLQSQFFDVWVFYSDGKYWGRL